MSEVVSGDGPSETEDVQYLAVGAEGGYVGRDGRSPEN
jgi:hypothetical protein